MTDAGIGAGRFAAGVSRRIGVYAIPAAPLVVLTVLVFAVSGGMLWVAGVNYDGQTGSAAQKIHPATYLSVLLLAWSLVRAGNPIANLTAVVERRPASVLLGIMSVALAVQITLHGGAGIAGAIDTFLLPALVCILLTGAEAPTLRRLETAIHVVMVANALLGIAEFVSGIRLFPFRLDGVLLVNETRSVALQGHPLAAATLTAVYSVALAAGGGSLRPSHRLMMIALQLAALVTFGGRAAIVVSVLLIGVLGVVALGRVGIRGRIPLLAAAALAIALPAIALVLAGLAEFGFFDALMARFANDGGSANARLLVLDLFKHLSWRDLIFGPDTDVVATMRRMNGLELGLENPIVRILLYQGALMTGLLTASFAYFLFEVARRCRPGIALPMLTFLLLVNTYESLGGKTTLLAKFIILLIALYRRPPALANPGSGAAGADLYATGRR